MILLLVNRRTITTHLFYIFQIDFPLQFTIRSSFIRKIICVLIGDYFVFNVKFQR